ncbi:MAG: phage tail family protein [Clostridia bacterium]|nr:phage tail family protein [Clostridia bacterium]
MVITFTNKHGTIRLNGGGTGNAWRMTDISGIGFPKKTFTYHQYANVYGQTINTVSIPNRIITISGDIVEQARNISLARIMRILNEDGELRIQTGNKIRRAFVRTLSFEPDQRKDAFRKFVWQVESDNPFFFGPQKAKFDIYQRTALLTSQFTLPAVFSERIMSSAVINSGDVNAEPIITITKPAGSEVVSQNLEIQLEAEGVSAEIALNHTIADGESVTMDIPNRKVTSSLSGNIIGCLSVGSVLSSFVIPPGFAMVTVKTEDSSLSVSCSFENQYLEASHDE